MAIVLDHHLLKEVIPVSFFIMYLVSLKYRKMDSIYLVFCVLQSVVISCYPFYDLFLSRGFLINSWVLPISFVQYASFSLLITCIALFRTQKINYSVTLSIIITSGVGYLYEIPRFLRLQGLPGLTRPNIHSPLIIDLQIICLILIPIMLLFRKIKVDLKIVLSGINYVVYCWVYYHWFDSLIAFRRSSVLWIWIPHIFMFRLPIMIFFVCLVSQINSSEDGFLWWLDWILMERPDQYEGKQ